MRIIVALVVLITAMTGASAKTKAELMAEINGNVLEVLGETVVASSGGIKTIDVSVLLTADANGAVARRATQPIYVKDGDPQEAWYGDRIVKNFEVITPEIPNDERLTEALELLQYSGVADTVTIYTPIDTSEFKAAIIKLEKNSLPVTTSGTSASGSGKRAVWYHQGALKDYAFGD